MSLSKDRWGYIAAGATVLAVSAAVYWYAYSGVAGKGDEEAEHDDNVIVVEEDGDEEPHEVKATLYKSEALVRSKAFSDLHYRVAFALLPGGKTFRGQVEIDFKLLREIKKESDDEPDWAFLDYTGTVHSVENNGKKVDAILEDKLSYKKDRIYFNPDNLSVGKMNKVIITFESSYVRDNEGVQYFKDPED